MKRIDVIASLVGAAALAALGACGGEPVGAKIPRANPKHVAGAAAAAATVMTLANPDSSGKRPESNKPKSLKGKKGSGETVPAGVLDRAEDSSALPLCSEVEAEEAEEAEAAETPPAKLELIPAPTSDDTRIEAPPRCRPDPDEDDEPAPLPNPAEP